MRNLALVALLLAGAIVIMLLVQRSRSESAPTPAPPAQPPAITTAIAAAPISAAVAPGSASAASEGSNTPPPPSAKPTATAPVATERAPRSLYTVDGFAVVRVGGGTPTTRPMGPDHSPRRSISGRVIDSRGNGIGGASVLADRSFHMGRGEIMALAGARTDASGAFTIANAPMGKSVVLALHDEDWSEIVTAGDDPLVLRMIGHGGLTAHFTYSGGPETFTLWLTMVGPPFRAKFETESDGTLAIPSLPPGRYKAEAGLAQGFGGGTSQSLSRDITIKNGETTDLTLAFTPGSTVAVITTLPQGAADPKGIVYWLFTGAAPRDGAEARARRKAEDAPSMTLGGGIRKDPAQFHDVRPGTYHACAGYFDLATMDALDKPFGCAPVTVANEPIREVTILIAD